MNLEHWRIESNKLHIPVVLHIITVNLPGMMVKDKFLRTEVCKLSANKLSL